MSSFHSSISKYHRNLLRLALVILGVASGELNTEATSFIRTFDATEPISTSQAMFEVGENPFSNGVLRRVAVGFSVEGLTPLQVTSVNIPVNALFDVTNIPNPTQEDFDAAITDNLLVTLHAGNNLIPGDPLESFVGTWPIFNTEVVRFDSIDNPVLQPGEHYWLSVAPARTDAPGLDGRWLINFDSPLDVLLAVDFANAGQAFANIWENDGSTLPLAFEIKVTAVPEPHAYLAVTTILLIVGVGLRRYKKLIPKLAPVALLLSLLILSSDTSAAILDQDFAPEIIRIGTVDHLVVQNDGRIIITGAREAGFDAINGIPRDGIARLNKDGTVDESFNLALINNSPLNVVLHNPVNDSVFIAGQTLSRVGGINHFTMAKISHDGFLDQSFIPTPESFASGFLRTIEHAAVQLDNHVLFVVDARITLQRFTHRGEMDSDFTPPDTLGLVKNVFVQPDGKIVVFGVVGNHVEMHRLLGDGQLDESFFGPGRIEMERLFQQRIYPEVLAVVFLPTGKTVIGGAFHTIDGNDRAFLVRLHEDGTVDESFSITVDNPVYSIAVAEDGGFYISGSFNSVNGVERFRSAKITANDEIDTRFVPERAFKSETVSVIVEVDQKPLIAGVLDPLNGTFPTGVLRYNTDGTVDASYAPQVTRTPVIRSIAQRSDKRIVIVGSFSHVNGEARDSIALLEPDGTLSQKPFNGQALCGGIALNPVESLHCTDVLPQPDNQLLIVHRQSGFEQQAFLRRIDEIGEVDTTFIEHPVPGSRYKIITHGELITLVGHQHAGDLIATRLDSDGNIDRTFTAPAFQEPNVWDATVLRDGGVVLASRPFRGSPENPLFRLNPDGSFDDGYQADFSRFDNPSFPFAPIIDPVIEQPSGQVLIGVDFSITRLNKDGTVDESFSSPTIRGGGTHSFWRRPDGKLQLVGGFQTVNQEPRKAFALLDSNGALVENTSANGITGDSNLNREHSVIFDSSGNFIVAGDFTTIDGQRRTGIARILTDHPIAQEQVTIQNPVLQGQTFSLEIETEVGKTYTLESLSRVVDAVWISVSSAIGTGATIALEDADADATFRFYRVRSE